MGPVELARPLLAPRTLECGLRAPIAQGRRVPSSKHQWRCVWNDVVCVSRPAVLGKARKLWVCVVLTFPCESFRGAAVLDVARGVADGLL